MLIILRCYTVGRFEQKSEISDRRNDGWGQLTHIRNSIQRINSMQESFHNEERPSETILPSRNFQQIISLNKIHLLYINYSYGSIDPSAKLSQFITPLSSKSQILTEKKTTRCQRRAADKFAAIRDLWEAIIAKCGDSFNSGGSTTVEKIFPYKMYA